MSHDIGDGIAEFIRKCPFVICRPSGNQCVRPRQAAGMARQDLVGAASHDSSRLLTNGRRLGRPAATVAFAREYRPQSGFAHP
jgi:hypothetical protein